jgi:hypothetical protein
MVRSKNPARWPGFLFRSRFSLKLLVEFAGRAGDVDSAGDATLAVFDALDDAGGFVALGTIGGLGGVHYLLAVTCFCDLCHFWGVSPSWGCLCTHGEIRGFNGAAGLPSVLLEGPELAFISLQQSK